MKKSIFLVMAAVAVVMTSCSDTRYDRMRERYKQQRELVQAQREVIAAQDSMINVMADHLENEHDCDLPMFDGISINRIEKAQDKVDSILTVTHPKR